MVLSRRRFMTTTAAAVASAAVARPAVAQGAQKAVIGFVPGNSVYWNIDVAVEKGFFKDAGFDPELSVIQSSPHSIQQAIIGASHIAVGQPETFVAAVERGGTVLGAFSAPMNRADWALNVQADIKSLKDLKGKVIGVSALRNAEVWMTNQMLAKAGLKKGEYDYKVVGVSPQKVAALKSGSIAATILFQPSAELAAQQGYPAIATYGGIRAYPSILYVINKEWAAKDNSGKRLAGVIRKAHDWLWSPANKEEALAIIMKYTKRSRDIVEKVYAMYFVTQKFYSRTGEIEVTGLNTALADMASDGLITSPAPPATKYLLDKNLGGLWS
jgi:ABC-type nitrate/sulfonate/bicarbonate transport system substrate-binding protein